MALAFQPTAPHQLLSSSAIALGGWHAHCQPPTSTANTSFCLCLGTFFSQQEHAQSTRTVCVCVSVCVCVCV